MASPSKRLPGNAPGDFFVDSTCIDCDTCRQLAPAVFSRDDKVEQSIVARQPASPLDEHRALMALVACPTSSIGAGPGKTAAAAAAAFPELLEDEVYYCGFTAASSFGASSYLIRRPEGNVLIDSPRAAGPLLRRLREMGGVRTLFLTHSDDVADHAALRRQLGCERVMHAADVHEATRSIERAVHGDLPVRLAGDLTAIPVPGHTRGSMALLYREKFLFTGDHLWYSGELRALNASRGVCWYSWPSQLDSLERLLAHRFEWILPGHGGRYRAASSEAMAQELRSLLTRLRGSSK